LKSILTQFGLANQNNSDIIASIIASFVAFYLLQYFPIQTLLLLGVLIAIVIASFLKKEEFEEKIILDKFVGVFIAYSLSSSLILAMVLSTIFYILFDRKKPSVIGMVYKNLPKNWGLVADDLLSGAFGGIASAAVIKAMDAYLIN